MTVKLKFISFILVGCFASITPLRAQWTRTALPDSGFVTSLLVSGENLFAATIDGGLYRSMDNGNSWTMMDSVFSRVPVVSLAARENEIFAGTYALGVYGSADDGSSWLPAAALPYPDVYALAASGTDLFAASASGAGDAIYHSTTSGSTWTDITNEIATRCTSNTCWTDALAIVGDKLFAGTRGSGVFRTTIGDVHWVEVNAGLTTPGIRSFATNGLTLYAGGWSDSGDVFKSTDNGSLWTRISSNVLKGYPISIITAGNALLVATTESGICLSTNDGANWSRYNDGLPHNWASQLAVNDSFLFVGLGEGVSKGGGVWRRPLLQIPTGVWSDEREAPITFALNQNYPNPFNPSTTISYSLPTQSHVTLKVFNVLGQELATLVSGIESPGSKSVRFDGTGLPSGVYFYRLQSGSYSATKMLMIVK